MKRNFTILFILIIAFYSVNLIGCETIFGQNTSNKLVDYKNIEINDYHPDFIEISDNKMILNRNDGFFIIIGEADNSDSINYESNILGTTIKEYLLENHFTNVNLASQTPNYQLDNAAVTAIANGCRYIILIGINEIKTFEYGGGIADSLSTVYIFDLASGLNNIFEKYEDNKDLQNLTGKNNSISFIIATTAYNNMQKYYPSWKTFSESFANVLANELTKKSSDTSESELDLFYSLIKDEIKDNANNLLNN